MNAVASLVKSVRQERKSEMGRHGKANESSGMEGCEETLKPTKAQLVIYTGGLKNETETFSHTKSTPRRVFPKPISAEKIDA